jgi:hypothetical protein
MSRVLFILKKRQNYGIDVDPSYDITLSSGLYNSCRFVCDLLQDEQVEAKIAIVCDNNDIDREVHAYKPTHVIVEALWVVPEKFDVLKKLHPHVEWIVRLHSNSPFIATEGIAFAWIEAYLQRGIKIAANHELMFADLISTFPTERHQFIFLPNFYPLVRKQSIFTRRFKDIRRRSKVLSNRRRLDVGCFGAVRPLKNQFTQALAAIKFANENDWHLHFHINAGRVERGDEVLKNLRALFRNSHHVLVEHGWLPHHEFLVVLEQMDISLQVSFTETFNIVTADAVGLGVPVVTSHEVDWVSDAFKASPNHSHDIAKKMGAALNSRIGPFLNYWGLVCYNRMSAKQWAKYFHGKDNVKCR